MPRGKQARRCSSGERKGGDASVSKCFGVEPSVPLFLYKLRAKYAYAYVELGLDIGCGRGEREAILYLATVASCRSGQGCRWQKPIVPAEPFDTRVRTRPTRKNSDWDRITVSLWIAVAIVGRFFEKQTRARFTVGFEDLNSWFVYSPFQFFDSRKSLRGEGANEDWLGSFIVVLLFLEISNKSRDLRRGLVGMICKTSVGFRRDS